MKRILVALLMGTMIFAASGCGGETKPAGGDAASTDAAAAAPAAGEQAAEPAAK